jgi:hypothetical protein
LFPTSFPTLRKSEVEILKRFFLLDAIQGEWFINVVFPTPGGASRSGEPESMQKAWKYLTAKRIEAVCENATTVYLVEVKERVVPSALGELLMYKRLWLAQKGATKNIQMICVAAEDDKAVSDTLKLHGVVVYIV